MILLCEETHSTVLRACGTGLRPGPGVSPAQKADSPQHFLPGEKGAVLKHRQRGRTQEASQSQHVIQVMDVRVHHP